MKSAPLLQGKQILITRAEDRCQTLKDAIASKGGFLIAVSTIDITDPEDVRPLVNVFNELNSFDIAVFVSPNAVDKTLWRWQWYKEKYHKDNVPFSGFLTKPMRVFAIGPSTQQRLHQHFIKVTGIPVCDFSTEGLLELSSLQKVSGKRIVIFCGEGGRADLAEILRHRGAQVTFAYVYRRRCPNLNLQVQLTDWQKRGVDVVVGTSAESLYNLLEMVGEPGARWLKQLSWLVVSERIADLTKTLGFATKPIVAKSATNDAIFEALYSARESGIL